VKNAEISLLGAISVMERLAHAWPGPFNALASRAFRKIDVNENNIIESGELYVGVLLGYDKLNKILSKLGIYLDVPGKCYGLVTVINDANHRPISTVSTVIVTTPTATPLSIPPHYTTDPAQTTHRR